MYFSFVFNNWVNIRLRIVFSVYFLSCDLWITIFNVKWRDTILFIIDWT